MKKVAVSILFIVLCNRLLFSQNNDSTWFKKTLSDFGEVYFGISNEMGDFHKTESYFWGFDMGVYTKPFKSNNTKLKIGLGGAWLDNSVTVDLQTQNNYLSYPVNIKFGGLRLGMLFITDRIFVPSIDVLFAAGDLRYQVPQKIYNNYKNEIGKQTIPIYVLMPKMNFEVKITKVLKFGWGLSYRLVRGIDAAWSSNGEASDFGYHGTFVGIFGK